MSKDLIGTKLEDWPKERADRNRISFQALLDSYIKEISKIEGCGGELAVEKQHSKGRMTARERIKYLIDDNSYFNEIGRFAAYDMYGEYGDINSAGIVVGTADIDKRKCVIVANFLFQQLSKELILRNFKRTQLQYEGLITEITYDLEFFYCFKV